MRRDVTPKTQVPETGTWGSLRLSGFVGIIEVISSARVSRRQTPRAFNPGHPLALVFVALVFPAASESKAISINPVTDTYDYDAFGNLLNSSFTGAAATPNNYLFAGEQFDLR
jgi:hypothetical protein